MAKLRAQVRRGRPAALRPGQVVSRRAAAALVAEPVLARATACRSGATPRCSPSERDDHGATAEHARRFLRRLAQRARRRSPPRLPGLRGRRLLPLARRAAADQRRADRLAPRRSRPSASACAASSRAGSASRSATRCRSPRDERAPGRWRSTPWYLRGDRCFLVAGDSPLGFRLPLDSLPWARPADLPWIYPPDPNDDLPPLAEPRRRRRRRRTAPRRRRCAPTARVRRSGRSSARTRRRAARTTSRHRQRRRSGDGERRAAALDESAGFVVRTAISAEARHGRLYVFMPPTSALDDYLALVAAVEATARELRLPVMLEGYEPPKDPRLVAAARHARSRRDRGQRPSGVDLERTGRADDAPLRRRRARRASRPRSSCSTAATPAPAAATTSCSAARRRPTRRSCAGPTCSPA